MTNRIVEVSVSAGTPMRIGVPAEKPEQAISALIAFFSATDAVTSARLGLMEIRLPEGKSDFSYTVGIEATSDRESIHQKALDILRSVPGGRWPIAVVPVTPQYFTEQAIVFYRRQGSKGSWWSRLLGTK